MTRSARFPLVFMILISLTPILSIHFPRFLAFWPLIIGLGSCLWLVLVERDKISFSKPYFICIAAISTLCLMSTLWSISPENAFEDSIKASAILWLGGLLVCACKTLDTETLKPHFWLFPVAVTIAALICSFDLATNMTLYYILHGKEVSPYIHTSVMNRGVVCTTIFYFLSLLFLKNAPIKNTALLLSLLTFSVLLMLALTQSQAAQLAFLIGITLIFTFPSKQKVTFHILAVIITLSLMLTPYIVTMLSTLLADQAQSTLWLQEAYAGHRLEIWSFVTKYAMNNPLYGFGIEAAKYVPAFEHDYVHHKTATILHPHNFAIQIWIEFGVIGATLFSVILLFCIHRLSNIENLHVRKMITIILLITLIIASMTYGLWQSWWLGTFVFILAVSIVFTEKQHDLNHIQENSS